ncbi:unnamed protein product [Prunus armeniaca]
MGASQCIPRLAGEKMYQVNHMYGGEFVVYLKAMSCSCRRWDLCGIPCAHSISAIFHIDENPVEYVHECYKPETYMRSYEPIVHHIPSMDQWVKGGLPPIRPPFHKRQLGRPKRMRTRVPGEVQVPAPNPPNLLPPDVEHVEKKATIEEDVEDRLRQPKMGMLAKIKFKQLTMEMHDKMIMPQPKLMLPQPKLTLP